MFLEERDRVRSWREIAQHSLRAAVNVFTPL